MKVTVVGAGAWGTSLALLLDQNRHPVTIWGHNAEHLAEIARERTHDRALPNILLPLSLDFEPDLDRALTNAEVVVMAVPSRALRSVAGRMSGFRARDRASGLEIWLPGWISGFRARNRE